MNYFSGFLLLFIITSLVVFIIIVIFRMMKQEVIKFILPPTSAPGPLASFFLTFITFLHFLNLMQANLLFASLSTQVRRLKKNNSVSPIPLNLRDGPEGHLEPSGTSTMNLFYKKKLTAQSPQLTKKLHRICLSGF